MTQTTSNKVYWTIADLELLPDNGCHYEIIEGDLFVTRAPHWKHQKVCVNLVQELNLWSIKTGLGEATIAPGVIFTEADNVIPDVVWVSSERLAIALDAAGHLIEAPELVVEVLSPGEKNQQRDRQAKLKLYSTRGVQEYWIVNWQTEQVEIYRREQAILKLFATVLSEDTLTSPLLPEFNCSVSQLFI
ncbi:MAG: Uma2 family endonuclease [Cyanobacteria bacterium J06592_8]